MAKIPGQHAWLDLSWHLSPVVKQCIFLFTKHLSYLTKLSHYSLLIYPKICQPELLLPCPPTLTNHFLLNATDHQISNIFSTCSSHNTIPRRIQGTVFTALCFSHTPYQSDIWGALLPYNYTSTKL